MNGILSNFKTSNRLVVFCCFIVLFLLTIYPFTINRYPASVDYINHLAGFYIQANIDNDQWLKENYLVQWTAKPYVIIEWLGGFLANHIEISLAGRIILVLGITFICCGGAIIRKFINGHIDLWTCSILSIVYNYVLFYGFVSYYVSSGLALIAIGLWIKLKNISSIINILLFSTISTTLYFCHLYTLGIYAIFVIGYELGAYNKSNNNFFSFNIIKAALQFLPPIILYFIWWINYSQNGHFVFYNYGDFPTKIIALLSPLAFDFSRSDLASVLLIFISLFILRCFYNKGISIYDNMKIPLLLLLVVTIAMPSSLAGAWGTDFRYPFVFILLLAVSIKFDENNHNVVIFRRLFLSILLIATSYKIYHISESWKKINEQYQEFENALQYVDKGSRVLTIQQDSGILTGYNPRLYDHMSALSIIQRSTFWPLLFTINTPIYPTPKTEHIDTATGPNLTLNDLTNHKHKNGYMFATNCKVYWEKWEHDFDYLISIRFNDLSIINFRNLKLKSRGSFFDIYQIIH